MHKKEKIIQSIVQQGILPLYFHPEETTSIKVLKALYEAGIRVTEYTNRGKSAFKNFRSLKKLCNKQIPEMILGLGTILDSKAALKAIEVGAEFLVSPGYSKEIARLSDDENILWIPGCITATELMQVQASGPGFVKIFPAHFVGPPFIKSMKEVFPDLFFMPTGGVNDENIESWFKAGASAVGIGGNLISKTSMDDRDFDGIKSKTTELIKKIAAFRPTL
jgi:2-dehydro-3-deoxyphosphogluconate aldolase / (4S)-4-hydroxy-2-oxoglutarate aldolase